MNISAIASFYRPSMLRVVSTASFGTMLEYYDFLVFVALSSTLKALFIPEFDPFVSSILTAGTFGVAYLARPLGTLIFSPMSDRIGRKRAFVITLVLMGASTVLMGCLPTYQSAGVSAPVCLLLLRIVQGIALGGEYGSAAVYVIEHAPPERRGLFASFLQGTASLGLLLALLVVSLLDFHLTPADFSDWGWRVPFLISAPIVVVALYIRLGMEETPVFQALKDEGGVSRSPLADTLTSRASWKNLLVAVFGAQGGTSVTLYTSIIYMLYFMQNVLAVPVFAANLCVGIAILIAAPLYPFFGAVSDRYGRAWVMLVGMVLWAVMAYPCFAQIVIAVKTQSWPSVTACITVLAALTAMVMAPLPAFISDSFPPQSRTTGFGLSQQIGNILFGGFLPMISLALVNWSGNPLAGIVYSVISLLPCIGVAAIWGVRFDRRRSTSSR
ncbi:MFS transporter [Pseudomonas fluorescens]|uniref:MFS transporter n=1 Tax=Pseudomonas fluorescens TaxID=294 RepID=UPI001914B966